MVINKSISKIDKFCVLQADFFSIKFVGIGLVSPIISLHVITESQYLLNICHFHKCMYQGFKYKFFHIYYVFYTCNNIYCYSAFDLNCVFFHQFLFTYKTCAKLFDSFINVIILKACIFQSSVFFGTHTL